MTNTRPGRRSHAAARRTAAMLGAVVLVVAACGGGGADATPEPTRGSGSTPAGPTDAPYGGIQDQTFAVGEHFWHSGFRVDVVDGTIVSTEDRISKRVTIVLTLNVTFENTGTGTGFFRPPVAVVTSSNSYAVNRLDDGIRQVPGGLKAEGFFSFLIDDTFDLASAELLAGDPTQNQARVPLAGGGTAVRLEPVEVPISGMLSMELVDLIFTSASLRYDDPATHDEVEKGKQSLTIVFDALSRKAGNWNIFATDIALIRPDGIAIGPSGSEIGSLPGSTDGVETSDRWVRFVLDEMPSGDFTLQLTPGKWFVGGDGVTEATFEFSLP